jgi:hypothetical protein
MKQPLLRVLACIFSVIISANCAFAQTHVLSSPDLDAYAGEENKNANDSPGDVLFDGNPVLPQACASANLLATGYPAWTNYWAGWMVNMNNVSGSPLTVRCIEARFQGNDGTQGYRVYTKTGTFVGFWTTPGAWTLIGSIATGVNCSAPCTTGPSPVPITINVTIPTGATQAFYFTRTSNTTTYRHLYVVGTGTPGTTVYASDPNLQITEAEYIAPFFVRSAAGSTRRPSFQVYYDLGPLPIELLYFKAEPNAAGKTELTWATASETNNDYFTVEKTKDGINFEEVIRVKGAGTSHATHTYTATDEMPYPGTSYYRLRQTDYNGKYEYFNMVSVDWNAGDFAMEVFPNPADQSPNVSISGAKESTVQVVVNDFVGNKCFSKDVILDEEGHYTFTIAKDDKLSPGVYFISATSNDKFYRTKLVVK